jgi:hypothetical protein
MVATIVWYFEALHNQQSRILQDENIRKRNEAVSRKRNEAVLMTLGGTIAERIAVSA